MNDPFPAFAPSEEHEALRETVRALAEDKIAPRAAEVDETGEFPQERLTRWPRPTCSAVHIPEAYGGEGADAIATAIVIEEVARACASSSLIPAVNKLGTVPLLLSGVRGAQAALPAAGRARRGDVLLRAVRARGGLGRGRDEDPGRARRGQLGAERHQDLDHQRRRLAVLHGDGRHRPATRRPRHLGLRGGQGRPGLHLRRAGEEARHQGLADPGAVLRRLRDPGGPDDRRRGHGFKTALPRSTTPGSRSPPRRSASPRARWTTRPATCRSASSSASAIAEFQGVQFMLADMAMKVEAARQLTYARGGSPSGPCAASGSPT